MGPHNHQDGTQRAVSCQVGSAVKPGPGQLVTADLNQDPGLGVDVMVNLH